MNAQPELIGGRSNHAPLTDIGWKQAEALGARWRSENAQWDAVYASVAVRAIDTIRIALRDAMPIVVAEEIQELHQGRWQGMVRAEVYTPEMVKRIRKADGAFRPPDGESPRDVQERMSRWLDALPAQHSEQAEILACGHGYAIRTLVGAIACWSFNEILSRSCPNTSITTIEGMPGCWRILKFADVDHLVRHEDA